jgi:hypothetical protein
LLDFREFGVGFYVSFDFIQQNGWFEFAMKNGWL